MKKTFVSIALASLLGLGAAGAMAYPGMGPGPYGAPCPPQCMGQRMAPPAVDRAERVKARYAALERMIKLREDQMVAWNAYRDARVQDAEDRRARWAKYKEPAVDQQTRLERRIERLKDELKSLETITAKRAELMKVLDAAQNVALDGFEARFAMRHPALRRGPGPRGAGPKGPGPKPEKAPKDDARPL